MDDLNLTRSDFELLVGDLEAAIPVSCVTAEAAKIKILQIQDKQHDNRELKNLTRLAQFVAYLDNLEKVLSSCFDQNDSETSSYLMGPLWGSLADLLEHTSDVDQPQAFDKLLDSYEGHNSLELPWEVLRRGNTTCVLYNIYKNVISYQRSLMEMVQSRNWKNTFKAHWMEFTSDLGADRVVERSFQIDKTFLGQLRGNPQLYESPNFHSQLRELLESYCHNRKHELGKLSQEQNDKRAKQQADVFQWLGTDDYVDRMKDTHLKKLEESPPSGQWITKELDKWLAQPSAGLRSLHCSPDDSKMWMYGKKGAGKSVLSTYVMQHCADLDMSPCIFYCQEDNERANSCIAVLRALLGQILQKHPKLLSIYHLKKQNVQRNELQTEADAKSLLKNVIDEMPHQCFIIDGLDEGIPQEMQSLLEFFRDQVNDRDPFFPKALRIFISSISLKGLEDYWGDSFKLELTDACINPDIKLWLQTKVKDLAPIYSLEPHIVRAIVDRMFRRSEGMFLYANLAMDILKQSTRNDLIGIANKDDLPNGLKEAYAQIVTKLKARHQSVGGGNWEKARSVLGWLTCARRPLKHHELNSILSFDPKNKVIDMGGEMVRMGLDELCGSLVQLPGGDHVKLIHTTARQYLTEESDNQPLNAAELQFDLCVICLRYLCLDIFTNPDMSTVQLEDRCLQGYFAFQDYAASKWHTHFEILISHCSSVLWDLDRQEALWEALNDFVLHYQADLAIEPHAEFDENLLAEFVNYSFYDKLRTVWSFVFQRIKSPWEERKHISLLKLKTAVERNRNTLESFRLDRSVEPYSYDKIESYNGNGLFKCNRVDCYRFYDGFGSAKARKEHIDRHDRPFACEVDDCTPMLNGFSTNKDLERHKRLYHPEAIEGPSRFQPSRQGSSSSSTHVCSICGQQFTRHLSLKAHQSNHYGDRPYPCSLCGRRFTRVNDARRHERGGVCSNRAAARAGQARFRCRHCSDTFPRQALLNAHRRSRHSEITARPRQAARVTPEIDVSGLAD